MLGLFSGEPSDVFGLPLANDDLDPLSWSVETEMPDKGIMRKACNNGR